MFKKIAIVIGLGACLAGCVDKFSANKALDNMGMTDIQLSSWSPWFSGCSENEFFATSFNAKNSFGKPVSGVVCTTLFGASHVKTY